jgi:hypothetical protein
MNHIEFTKNYFYPFLKENHLLLYFNHQNNFYHLRDANDNSYISVRNTLIDDKNFNTSFLNNFNFFKSFKNFQIKEKIFYDFLSFLLEKKLSTKIIQKISLYKNWNSILNQSNYIDLDHSFLKKLFVSGYQSTMLNSTFGKILNHLTELQDFEITFFFTKNHIQNLKKDQFFLLKKLYYLQKPSQENNQFLELESFFKNDKEDYDSNFFLNIKKDYDTIIINFHQLKKDFFIDMHFKDSEYIKILKFITQNLKSYQSKFSFQNIIFDCKSINPKYVSFLLEKKEQKPIQKELIQKFLLKSLETYQNLILQEIQKDDMYTISCFYKAKELFKENSCKSTILNFVLLEQSVSHQKTNNQKIQKI